jgi:chloramphenicol 3-O phosphotransferase
VEAEVIVLNGGSSSGTSTLARCLQGLLGPTWLTFGVDDLIRALPGGENVDHQIRSFVDGGPPPAHPSGIEFLPDGPVTVDAAFRQAEGAWYQGLASMARCGTGVIIDEVFLGGRASQARLSRALSDLAVLWVGVHCAPEVAEARERQREDRVPGMARRQAERVHQGVVYDLVVDTTSTTAVECARAITGYLRGVAR